MGNGLGAKPWLALHALGRDGYLSLLSTALQGSERRARWDAASALGAFPHPSTISLLTDVWRGTSDIRRYAFEALIRRDGEPDLALAREGLVDSSADIRLRAAEEILALGLDAPTLDVVEPLVHRRETRHAALSLLIKRGDPRRTATLARSPWVRRASP